MSVQERTILDIKLEHYKKELDINPSIRLKAMGNSMWPFIKNGDRVIIERSGFNLVHPGDVVLVDVKGNILCHRIFSKTDDWITTKADALVYLDPPTGKQDLIGRTVAIERKGRLSRIDKRSDRIIGLFISRASFLLAVLLLPLRPIRRVMLSFNLNR